MLGLQRADFGRPVETQANADGGSSGQAGGEEVAAVQAGEAHDKIDG